MPQYSVISVGEGNAYGHPDEATLSRLRDADVTVFRPDEVGEVICNSDGERQHQTQKPLIVMDSEKALPSTTKGLEKTQKDEIYKSVSRF